MEPVVVPVARTFEDYVEAYSAIAKPRFRFFMGVVLAAMTAFLLTIAVAEHSVLYAILGMVDLGVAIACFWTYANTLATARKMYRAHQKHASQEYQFENEAVMIRTGVGDSRTQWAAFSRLIETKHLLLLQIENGTFYLVPKRCVPAERITELEAFLRTVIPAALPKMRR